MRNLVTIQKIAGILPIEGADAIELVQIMGWQCVSKKDEFKQNDLCVYFEVDSFLPVDDARYEFLKASSYRKNDFMGEGLRIKTMRFRGALSQGLALPLARFNELDTVSVGEDVTERLGVRKWEIPEVQGSAGKQIGNKPFGIPTTDETRVQSITEILDEFKGKPYYITTKMDGTSCTVYCKDGIVGVCGRNFEYADDDTCSMWNYIHKNEIDKRLIAYGKNIAVQGEFCGEGIQKNPLNLKEPKLFIFDVMLIEGGGYLIKFGLDGIKKICEELELEPVPVEEVGESFNYTLEELLEKSKGTYLSGRLKEGIVVRTREYSQSTELQQKMSFKVINNDFLLKEKD